MGKIAGRMDRQIERHPQQQSKGIEEEGHEDRERDAVDLHLEHAQVGSSDEPDHDQDGEQLGDSEIHHVRPEEVSLLMFEQGAAARTPFFQGEPASEHARRTAVGASAAKGTAKSRDKSPETGIRERDWPFCQTGYPFWEKERSSSNPGEGPRFLLL